MRLLLLYAILIAQCYSGVKIGFDFSSQYESGYINSEIDNGIVFSYDHMFNEKWGLGTEYLFPTDIDNQSIEIGIFHINLLRQLFSKDNLSLYTKIGYSIPDFEWNSNSSYIDDIDGGLMYGFQITIFNEFQISYSIDNSKINQLVLYDYNDISSEYYYMLEKNKIKCNRITLFYLF